MIKKQIIVQYIIYYLSQIILLIVPIVTIPYVSRILGPEQIGKYSYTQSFVIVAVLFCTLGMNTYAQREIAAVAECIKKRSKLFYEIMLLRLITVGIGIVIYIFMVFCFAESMYYILFMIQLVDIVASIIDITWLYYAIGIYKQLAVCNLVVKLGYIFSVFCFVKSKEDLWIYVLCHSLTSFIGNFCLCFIAKKKLDWIKVGQLNVKQHVIPVLVLFIPQIATQVYTVLDKCMIGWLTNDMSQNGYYEQASKIVHTILMLVTSFGVVMLSDNTKSLEKKEDIKIKIGESLEFLMFLAIPITVGCFGISDTMILVLLGESFLPVIPIIRLLSINVILIAISNVIGVQYLLVLRRQKEYTLSVVFGAFVNFFLNLMLIPMFQSLGAAMASVLAEMIVMMIQIVLLHKELRISKETKKNILKCLAGALGMLGIIFFLPLNGLNVFLRLAVQILCGIMCYGMLLIIMREKYCSKILHFLNKNIKKI